MRTGEDPVVHPAWEERHTRLARGGLRRQPLPGRRVDSHASGMFVGSLPPPGSLADFFDIRNVVYVPFPAAGMVQVDMVEPPDR